MTLPNQYTLDLFDAIADVQPIIANENKIEFSEDNIYNTGIEIAAIGLGFAVSTKPAPGIDKMLADLKVRYEEIFNSGEMSVIRMDSLGAEECLCDICCECDEGECEGCDECEADCRCMVCDICLDHVENCELQECDICEGTIECQECSGRVMCKECVDSCDEYGFNKAHEDFCECECCIADEEEGMDKEAAL